MEEEILGRLGRGDVSAAGELYGLYGRQVFAYAMSILKNSAQAEDAASEAFVRLYRRIATGKEIRNWKAYLYAVCRNVSFDLLTKAAREEKLVDSGASEHAVDGIETRLAVREAMLGLSGEEREIVTLYCIAGMKHREIAEITGQPEGTVRWKYRQALGKLRRELGGIGHE